MRMFKNTALLPTLLAFPGLALSAVNFFDPLDTANVPRLFSQTGIYSNIQTKVLDTAAKHFEVNSALWSDGTVKDRWIILPPGRQLQYVDTTDAFAYPDSTIFVKLFRFETVAGDTSSRIYWETRLLVKKTDESGNWHGFSYKWNAAGTEAHLVDLLSGFDTVAHLADPQGYRKWQYPSQMACYDCHRVRPGTRGVLGFLPAQLKRPSAANPSINQVTHLFNQGVFAGVQPTAAQLGRRWRGMQEPVPTGLSPDERFRVIDTMARSYLAANCSGCHGTSGLGDGAPGRAAPFNLDFHTLVPRVELGNYGTGTFGLDASDTEMLLYPLDGRYRFITSVTRGGMATAPGSTWHMARPGASTGKQPAFVVAGYPSYSAALFRQWARVDHAMDSIQLAMRLEVTQDPQGWSSWIFSQPWGSKAWRDTLAARGVSLTSEVLTSDAFTSDINQMPPIATFVPDTAALRVLGEWAKNYRTLYKLPDADSIVRIAARRPAAQERAPEIRNHVLVVPEEWSGPARMAGLTGRSYALTRVGEGRYAIPLTVPPGIYYFTVGERAFRAQVMR